MKCNEGYLSVFRCQWGAMGELTTPEKLKFRLRHHGLNPAAIRQKIAPDWMASRDENKIFVRFRSAII